MENEVIRYKDIDPDYKKCEKIIKAFDEYPMDFCDFGIVQRILFFPEHGYYVLTVFSSDKENVDAKGILEKELKSFPDYKYDESEMVIILDDSEEEVLDDFGDTYISEFTDLFGQIFWNLYSTLKSTCIRPVNGLQEKEFDSLMEKMRKDVWDKVFVDEVLPDKLGYERT